LNNQLTELPELPNNLKELYCTNNQLTELPDLFDILDNLKYLDCSGNQLTELPELPNNLKRLYCYNNQLTELPELPNSKIFIVIYVILDNLPFGHKKLYYIFLIKFIVFYFEIIKIYI
jgi:Leucine-rich repeat (LRR) protein